MINPYKYSFDNKRYQTLNYYLKTTYHHKVAKISLDAGFTCPNRDGTCGYHGCLFCSDEGSGEFTQASSISLLKQYAQNKALMQKKWPNCLTIPYFQSFTNTYGPLSKIQACVEPFLKLKEVVAISIATRPDCLDDEKISYLDSLCDQKAIWIELGVQSTNDTTMQKMNRGHDFQCVKTCLEKLAKTRIKVCLHIINSLIGETEEDMLKTVKDLKPLSFDAIKIHMLYIASNSNIAPLFLKKPFKLLTATEYIDIVIKQLELLDEKIIVERLTGDPKKELLIAPNWVLNKTAVLNAIDKEMVKRKTYQGRKYQEY